MSLPPTLGFTLSLPTEGGFLGRECNGADCRRYFKVHQDAIAATMHCPYCGEVFRNAQLWTSDQVDFIHRSVAHEIGPEIVEHLRNHLRRSVTPPPGWRVATGPVPRPPAPEPLVEKPVDSELRCPDCNVRFQVDGIFGYCPGCRSENLRLYDADLEIIRREVRAGTHPDRSLRHAYADLVSTFEIFCRKEGLRHGIPKGRFQNVQASRDVFQVALSVDILQGIPADQELALRRVFQKRHITEHNGGIVDQRYVKEVPEDAALLGQQAPLALAELELAAQAIRIALENLVRVR